MWRGIDPHSLAIRIGMCAFVCSCARARVPMCPHWRASIGEAHKTNPSRSPWGIGTDKRNGVGTFVALAWGIDRPHGKESLTLEMNRANSAFWFGSMQCSSRGRSGEMETRATMGARIRLRVGHMANNDDCASVIACRRNGVPHVQSSHSFWHPEHEPQTWQTFVPDSSR